MSDQDFRPSPPASWAEENMRAYAQAGLTIPSVQSMSLRDYFAAQVLASWGEVNWNDSSHNREALASTAYAIADAMLKARGAK